MDSRDREWGISWKKNELTALKKNWTEFPIELSLSAVKLKNKWNAIGMARDITERKNMEEELLAEIKWRKKCGNGRSRQ